VAARKALNAALLLAIVGFTVAAVLQGQGGQLLGAIGTAAVFALVAVVLMLRWTASAMFWGGLLDWLRRRGRR